MALSPEQEEALRLSEGQAATPSNLQRVAKATTIDDARWAFGQWELRNRARAKFALANRMLFDREALEMATHERVAAYHASQFPAGELVVDMTCGLGADTIALASRGPVVAYELSEERAEMARFNLAVHGLEAEIIVADGLEAPRDAEFAFCDPSRRVGGRRTLDLAAFSPDPRAVAARFSSINLGLIKLSPMLQDAELESFGGPVWFVSFGGECREALVHCGDQPMGGRFALHVESGEIVEADLDPAAVATPSRYIYEADPAAIRAHCLGAFCVTRDLSALADSNGYLTGDRLLNSPWVKGYEVLAHHSADIARTRKELRRLGGGTPVVKARASVDVDSLRRQLKGEGEELVVIVYPDGKSLKHAICRRVVRTDTIKPS